ncbi:energy transducer TonB [Pseudolysobacter antarcticus]|uniref:Protein TonB n=1 Tax=Pseudolysobacter antarcticus TaxID=2511995 RepID=A0A411HG53_9GAMM|nr:energy transducer TonB [Pseudolysobacter antarcticus]QBB69496.1 energy transducer TonB [Pseudolysobacter antarcticus]
MRKKIIKDSNRGNAVFAPALTWRPLSLILCGALLAACQDQAPAPKPADAPKPAAAAAAAVEPGSVTPDAAAVPLTPADINQLLQDARKHLQAQRLVAPPGNNALENYSRVLEADPKNLTARDALRELFPFAVSVAEQNINSGTLDESERIVTLMSKSDPNNNTLLILRGKIDAKRKLADQTQKDKDTALAAATAAAAAKKGTPTSPSPADAATPTAATPAAAPAPVAAAPTPAPAPVAAVPAGGESHDAKAIATPSPEYPPAAYRAHTDGWVQVAFTVTEQGAVADVKVTGSQPARVFDKAAVSAIQRWTFTPKMENGKAVAAQMSRRLEFKATQ